MKPLQKMSNAKTPPAYHLRCKHFLSKLIESITVIKGGGEGAG